MTFADSCQTARLIGGEHATTIWRRKLLISTGFQSTVNVALSLRLGQIDRMIYDESGWAPTVPGIPVNGNAVIPDVKRAVDPHAVDDRQPIGKVVLLMAPPDTNPTRTSSAAMANADNTSTADELVGIGAHEAENRRSAAIAQHRWENEGGALHSGHAYSLSRQA